MLPILVLIPALLIDSWCHTACFCVCGSAGFHFLGSDEAVWLTGGQRRHTSFLIIISSPSVSRVFWYSNGDFKTTKHVPLCQVRPRFTSWGCFMSALLTTSDGWFRKSHRNSNTAGVLLESIQHKNQNIHSKRSTTSSSGMFLIVSVQDNLGR